MQSPVAIPKLATCLPCELAMVHWLECHMGIWKVVALIPTGSSDFFLSFSWLYVISISNFNTLGWLVGFKVYKTLS